MSGIRSPNVPLYSPPPGTPPLAVAAGLAIGYGLAYAVRGAMVREAAVANFELVIGGYSINSVDVLPLKGQLSTAQALEKAINSGLRTLTEKISAMQYWNSPYQKDGALPNPPVNTDAPSAALRARRGSPVTLVR